MRTAAIAIICKTPKAGSSKTRLHPVLGPQPAADLAGCFLRDVAVAVDAIGQDIGRCGYAVYSPEGSEADLLVYLPDGFKLVCRRDASLGVVLSGATEYLLGLGHDCVFLINADSPTMSAHVLTDAIAAIRAPGDRVVLGPTIDGGYYLIGLKAHHARLFEDIAWSTETVLKATLQRARDIGLAVHRLPLWYDVDDGASLRLLLGEFAGVHPVPGSGFIGGPATFTRAFLATHPVETART